MSLAQLQPQLVFWSLTQIIVSQPTAAWGWSFLVSKMFKRLCLALIVGKLWNVGGQLNLKIETQSWGSSGWFWVIIITHCHVRIWYNWNEGIIFELNGGNYNPCHFKRGSHLQIQDVDDFHHCCPVFHPGHMIKSSVSVSVSVWLVTWIWQFCKALYSTA